MVQGQLDPRSSWWIGLTRAELREQIALRAAYFHQQRSGFLEVLLTEWRDAWEPRHATGKKTV